MTKYCPNCGAENPDDAKYCIKCGIIFKEDQSVATQKISTYTALNGLGMAGNAQTVDYHLEQTLNSIKKYLLVAWVFSLIVLLGIIYINITSLFSFTYYYSSIITLGPLLLMWPVMLFLSLILSLAIFFHINSMRKAANNNDINKLSYLNSVGWAVAALIFDGIIPGIMLFIANGLIKEVKTSISIYGQQPGIPVSPQQTNIKAGYNDAQQATPSTQAAPETRNFTEEKYPDALLTVGKIKYGTDEFGTFSRFLAKKPPRWWWYFELIGILLVALIIIGFGLELKYLILSYLVVGLGIIFMILALALEIIWPFAADITRARRVYKLGEEMRILNAKMKTYPLSDNEFALHAPKNDEEAKNANCYVATPQMLKARKLDLKKYSIPLISRNFLSLVKLSRFGSGNKFDYLLILNDKGESFFVSTLTNINALLGWRIKARYFTIGENQQLAKIFIDLNQKYAG